jgi:hypothetical protein
MGLGSVMSHFINYSCILNEIQSECNIILITNPAGIKGGVSEWRIYESKND